MLLLLTLIVMQFLITPAAIRAVIALSGDHSPDRLLTGPGWLGHGRSQMVIRLLIAAGRALCVAHKHLDQGAAGGCEVVDPAVGSQLAQGRCDRGGSAADGAGETAHARGKVGAGRVGADPAA
jgi:hypothetical protein